MANPRLIKKYPITNWTTVGGVDYSDPIFVGDYRDVVLTIAGTGTAVVLGTNDIKADQSSVDFTIASAIDNSYISLVIADLGIANTYATTLVASGDTKMGEVNTNLLTWICVTRTAGTLDAFITICDNS